MKKSAFARLGKRLRRGAVLLLTLGLLGTSYAAMAPASSAQDATQDAGYIKEGQRLYNEGCISCHGMNAEGVQDRGPSLVGVGQASVEFQLSTGRMPAARQEVQAPRKPAKYDADQIAQIAAYIQSLKPGPVVPNGDLRDQERIAEGGALFRTNCASCHSFSGSGGALSSGKRAPSLEKATDRQIYAAMLTGPQDMPVFGDNQLSQAEKEAIIAYVQDMKSDKDPGGFGIGRTGPVPEGLVVFLVGIIALVFATVWIAGKS